MEEKPIPSAEHVDSVLCGSLATGGTSLAIAEDGAAISHIPLYLYIALLKHEQVHEAFVIWLILSQLS